MGFDVISTVPVQETAILVGAITDKQSDFQTKEYLDELE